MPAYSVVVSIGLSCTELNQLSLVPFSFLFPDLLVVGSSSGPCPMQHPEKKKKRKIRALEKRGAGHRRKALT